MDPYLRRIKVSRCDTHLELCTRGMRVQGGLQDSLEASRIFNVRRWVWFYARENTSGHWLQAPWNAKNFIRWHGYTRELHTWTTRTFALRVQSSKNGRVNVVVLRDCLKCIQRRRKMLGWVGLGVEPELGSLLSFMNDTDKQIVDYYS